MRQAKWRERETLLKARIKELEWRERETLLKARIKELENLICPGELHEYQKVDEEMHLIDVMGTVIYDRRYVCKRCYKVTNRTEYC